MSSFEDWDCNIAVENLNPCTLVDELVVFENVLDETFNASVF
jgi:hypothetical protein